MKPMIHIDCSKDAGKTVKLDIYIPKSILINEPDGRRYITVEDKLLPLEEGYDEFLRLEGKYINFYVNLKTTENQEVSYEKQVI